MTLFHRKTTTQLVPLRTRSYRKARIPIILPEFPAHVTDEKPITARQCINALAQVGQAKPWYVPQILACFHDADLSKYKDSMHPLIERDMAETEKVLTA